MFITGRFLTPESEISHRGANLICPESTMPRLSPQSPPRGSLHLEGKGLISSFRSSPFFMKQNSCCGEREDGHQASCLPDRARNFSSRRSTEPTLEPPEKWTRPGPRPR
jgi:hypothetical protein